MSKAINKYVMDARGKERLLIDVINLGGNEMLDIRQLTFTENSLIDDHLFNCISNDFILIDTVLFDVGFDINDSTNMEFMTLVLDKARITSIVDLNYVTSDRTKLAEIV